MTDDPTTADDSTTTDSPSTTDDSTATDDQTTADDSVSRPYETRVPADESPTECAFCGRPLESEDLLVLHEGLDHWERLDDERREAFRAAYADESDDLRTFRLKMLGLLILVYFAFLFVYSYFTSDPFSATNAGFLLVGVSSEFLRE